MIAPDSSVVIAALAPWHVAHHAARAALRRDEPRLVAHVAFETTAALSRMPEGHRVAPAVVLDALELGFPGAWLALSGAAQRACIAAAVAGGLRGGSLYDALIAATAREHGATLVSADRRAHAAYELTGAAVVFVGS